MPPTLHGSPSFRLGLGRAAPPMLLAAVGLFASLFSCCLRAQSFAARLFSQEEGLDNRSVIALAQQPDGHLWIATENGLFRYDGAHFLDFGRAQGLADPRLRNLFIDPSSTVWAATLSGLFYLDPSRDAFQEATFHAKPILVGVASQFAAGDAGEVLVTDATGHILSIVRQPGESSRDAQLFSARHPRFQSHGRVEGILVDRYGTLWFGCAKTICSFREPGRSQYPGQAPSAVDPNRQLQTVPADYYDTFFQDRSGRIWARSLDRLICWSPNGAAPIDLTPTLPASASQTHMTRIAQDGPGHILITTVDGFAAWDGHRWSETRSTTQGPIAGATDLLWDREGALWIGTAGSGLLESLGYARWRNFDISQGLPSPIVFAIQTDSRGQVWIGHKLGISVIEPNPAAGEKAGIHPVLPADPALKWIENMAPGPAGGIWAAAHDGDLWRFDANRRPTLHTHVPDGVESLLAAPGGTLWIAGGNGLYTLDCPASGQVRGQASDLHGTPCLPRPVTDPALRGRSFTDMRFDSSGDLWIAGDPGLFRLPALAPNGNPGSPSALGPAQRVQIPGVENKFTLIAPAPGGTLWLAGSFPGVVHAAVAGDRVRILKAYAAPELASDYIQILRADPQGRIWAGTDRGVNVLQNDSVSLLTDEDGLIWNDTDWKAFHAAPDGSIWIGTSGGVSNLLDPEAALTRGPFRGVVEETAYGGVQVHDGDSIPWNNGVLTTRFAGLTFRDNRHLLYRYRLEGFDPSTISTSIPFARFQQLPPGHYTLRLTAEDQGHHAASLPASFSFTLVPPWWRTRLFEGFLLLVLSGFAVLLWHWSNLALIAQRERLKRLVAERTGELQRLAITDSLTGLLNRGAIMSTLAREAAAASKDDLPLCIAIVDLDHFKRINDTFGHQAGDEVLREAALRLATGVRASDFVGRYGGEEFLIVFRNVPREFGRERCEAIRKAVCASPIRVQGRELFLTASIGLAWSRSTLGAEDALVALADRALYTAKANGRNRVELAPIEPEALEGELTSIH